MEIAKKSKKKKKKDIVLYLLTFSFEPFFCLTIWRELNSVTSCLAIKGIFLFPATKLKKISLLTSFSFSISKHHWWTWLWFSARCRQHQKKDNIEIGKKNWNQRFLTNPCKLTHFLQTSVSAWVLGITS